jgi:gas vesicle protein
LYYEKESAGATNFVAGLAIGAVLGASIALLTAPQAGKRTRRQVVRALASARDNAGEEWEDVSGRMRSMVRKGRRRIRR